MSGRSRTEDPTRWSPRSLRGANLRYCLLALLGDQGPATITELQARLEHLGLQAGGDAPNKVISDALRHERTKGRVERIGRGRFAPGVRSERTVRRHRARLRALVVESRRRDVDASRS